MAAPIYKIDIIKIINLDILLNGNESAEEENIEDCINTMFSSGYELDKIAGLTQSQSGAYYIICVFKQIEV